MPDKDGWVSGAERKAFGPLGRPPDSFAYATKDIRRRWKDLQNLAKRVLKMYDPDKRRDYAKHVAKERARLVEMMDNCLVNGKPRAVAQFKGEPDER